MGDTALTKIFEHAETIFIVQLIHMMFNLL